MSGRLQIVVLLMAVSVAVFGQIGVCGAEIRQSELVDLPGIAEVIALAGVTEVTKKSDTTDEVTLKIAAVIKGSLKTNTLKVPMETRGAKGFDPAMKVGDTGVFFLKEIADKSARLAYMGSTAIFTAAGFAVSKKSYVPQKDFVKVRLETSMGDIVVELNRKAVPVTVKNFLEYVEEGFYTDTIFHRVIKGFMVQSGGFTVDMAQKKQHAPIVNEGKNGLKNNRGTIAMGRTNQPDSATSHFYINHKDNSNLDAGPRSAGYAVFGKVVEGMDVVDKIASVKTANKGQFGDVPVEPVMIKSAAVIAEE